MRRSVLTAISIWLCLLPFGAAAQSLFADSLLAGRLDSIVSARLSQGSQVGIAVYDLTDRRAIYDHGGDQLCRPASVMKLLTAVSALEQEKGAEPFSTELWCRGELRADTLVGDVYVVGGMDPEFTEQHLDTLLAALPFRVLQGHLYGDVSMKDSLYWGNGWVWDDNPAAFQPYLSPLMLNKGVVSVTVSPAQTGLPARLQVAPQSTYYTLQNRTYSNQRAAGALRLQRNWLENGNDLVLSGNVTGRRELTINVHSSQNFFMHTLCERMAQRVTMLTEGYAFAELPRDAQCVLLAAVHTSMDKVLEQMLKESDNLNAEAVFNRLALQASGHRHVGANEGIDALQATLRRAGVNPDRCRLSDGCGLSVYNLLSPRLLVALLRYAHNQPRIYESLYKALPISGVDGTLQNRMRGGSVARGRVHAKTGSVSGISTLAGYLHTRSGHQLAFAIMNQNQLKPAGARALQDAVCEFLVRQ